MEGAVRDWSRGFNDSPVDCLAPRWPAADIDLRGPHAPARFTPGGDPFRPRQGGIASSAQKVNPDSQGEPPWPLVRREPQTAHAVNADAIGALPHLTFGWSAA